MAKWIETKRLNDGTKLLINTKRLLSVIDVIEGSVLVLNEGTTIRVKTPYEEWKNILQKENNNVYIKLPNLDKYIDNIKRTGRFIITGVNGKH